MRGTALPADSQAFCCLGCRFAFAASGTSAESAGPVLVLAQLGIALFLTLNVVMFSMVLWSADVYEAGVASGQEDFHRILNSLWRWLCGLLSLPVLWLLGAPMVRQAWSGLIQRRWTMDALLLIGIFAAFLFSWWSVFRESGPVYFEVACVVLVLVTIGRWMEAQGRAHAKVVLARLDGLLPVCTRRWRCEGGPEEIPLAAIQPGDELLVLPGERIPTDGIVVSNPTSVDERLFTGESVPVVKELGSEVLGGTTVVDSPLRLRATCRPEASSVQRYVQLVRDLLARPSRWQRRADRLVSWFLPTVVIVALASTCWHGWTSGLDAGVLAGLAVLLISCPCALGLATPLAIWYAVGHLASRQILLRDPDGLEKLTEVRAIVFDKTGTLTSNRLFLRQQYWDSGLEEKVGPSVVVSLATASTHPLTQALRRALGSGVLSWPVNARSIPGRGVAADECGPIRRAWLGSPRCLAEAGINLSSSLGQHLQKLVSDGEMVTCVAWEGQLRGFFTFEEAVRPDAEKALADLRSLVPAVVILSGDNRWRTKRLGETLGLPAHGDLTPADKLVRLAELRGRLGPVAMIGDGLNDAPALAAADVSIALGCGADLARDTATICLLSNELSNLPFLWRLARQTKQTIQLNLFWAVIYNIIGMSSAALGWINPIVAAVAMVASSSCVLANTLRLATPITSGPSSSVPSNELGSVLEHVAGTAATHS